MGGIVKGVGKVVGKVVDVGKDLAGPVLAGAGLVTGNPGLVQAGLGIGGIFGQQEAAKQAEKGAEQAARAADPFGAYRSQFGDQLLALYADPSQISQLPGYQFLSGYGRSVEDSREYGNRLRELLDNPSTITSLPGYQFRLNEGLSGIDRNASRAGYLGSGNRLMELMRYGQDYASSEYDKEVNRLAGLMQDSRDFESAAYNSEINRLMGLSGAAGADYGSATQALLAAATAKSRGTTGTLKAIGETVDDLSDWWNRKPA